MNNQGRLRSRLYIDDNSLIFISSQTINDYDYNSGIFDRQYPLIYVQMEAAHTILKEAFLSEYPWYVKFFVTLILIIVLWILYINTGDHLFVLLSILAGLLYIIITTVLFFYASFLPYLLPPLSGFFFSLLILYIYRMLSRITLMRREREKQKELLIHTDKLITLGTMVSGIAHDVNNPNNIIAIEAEFIAKNFVYFREVLDSISDSQQSLVLEGISYPALKKEYTQSIEGIRRASRKINNIVRELKNFYKKASPDRKELVHLDKVIQSALLLLSHEINKTAVIHFHPPSPGVPVIAGNHQRLEQAIINILHNSCNAIKDKNKLQENRTKGKITITIEFDSAHKKVFIHMKDNGCGIDEKIISRITEPFFSTRLSNGGSGLGLYIVKTIINAHHGALSFNSEKGKGTETIISIPVEKG
jgi:signal transduction histidine kinase